MTLPWYCCVLFIAHRTDCSQLAMEIDVDQRRQKAVESEQSHERWQVNEIGVKYIHATVPVVSACNPTLSLFKETNADLRQLDCYVHNSSTTGVRV